MVHAPLLGDKMFNSTQTLGTDPFFNQVSCQHDVYMTASHRLARSWLQSGQCIVLSYDRARSGRTGWHLSVLRMLCSITWTVQPGQVVPLRDGRWKSIRLQPILASLSTHLRSLYITTVRGKAEGGLFERDCRLLSYIIVSFAIRLTSGTGPYRCYGQLCQYTGVLSSFMLVFVPLCRSYAALYHVLTLQIVKLRCVEMMCSTRCSAAYLIEYAS
jgi:hypothetical protein